MERNLRWVDNDCFVQIDRTTKLYRIYLNSRLPWSLWDPTSKNVWNQYDPIAEILQLTLINYETLIKNLFVKLITNHQICISNFVYSIWPLYCNYFILVASLILKVANWYYLNLTELNYFIRNSICWL